jgi:hypothetical protein
LAWAARCVVCLPNAELSASTNDSGVVAIAGSFRVFIAVFRWNDPFPRATPRVPAFKLDLIPGPPVGSITRVSTSLKSYWAAEFQYAPYLAHLSPF